MAIVTVTNQKGGVGKTTTTLNLGIGLQRRGWRVLAVDFDPQGNLTTCCGLDDVAGSESRPTLADALLTTVRGPTARKVRVQDVIVQSPAGIDLVPADKHLAAAEAALYSVYGREYALRDTLEMVKDRYDVILVDSVPTLGLLAINGLAAAHGVIIPVQAEFLAVHGLAQLLESVLVVRERLNPDLSVWGVLMTMVDPRTKHSREVTSAVRESLPEGVNVFDAAIPVSVKLKESARAGRSIFEIDSHGRAAQAYAEFASEVEQHLGKPGTSFSAQGVRDFLDDYRRADASQSDGHLPEGSDGPRSNGHGNGRGEGSRGLERTVNLVPGSADGPDGKPPERGGRDERDARPAASAGADNALIGSGRQPIHVCPKLGIETNSREHLPTVSHEHRCFADQTPLEISNYAQRLYCLTDRYGTCGRFLRAQMSAQTVNQEQTGGFLARVRNALNRPSG